MAHFSEVKIPKRNEDALIIDNDLNSSEEKQKVLLRIAPMFGGLNEAPEGWNAETQNGHQTYVS
nr:hypothetical protein I308_05321 [Cryptococcus tetragattii IND107]